MTTPVNVNIGPDICSGVSIHMFCPLPSVAPLVPMLSCEVPTRMDWAAGKTEHPTTAKVFHEGEPIILAGHDCGQLIRDEAALLPWMINSHSMAMAAVSSRAVSYTASTVKMESKETGLASWNDDCRILPCGDPVPLPHVKSETNMANSVMIGATENDIAVGDFTLEVKVRAALFTYIITEALRTWNRSSRARS